MRIRRSRYKRSTIATPITNRGEPQRIWILNDNYVAYHQEHLQLGTTGYMIAGNDKVAECKVVELKF